MNDPGAAPPSPEAPEAPPEPSALARDAIAILGERVTIFERRVAKTIEAPDPENIHDLRVASRRLREGLALFEPFYPPGRYRKQFRRVRRVTRRLGDARNADVARELCAALLAETSDPSLSSALAYLTNRFERDRKKADAVLHETLVPEKIEKHVAQLAAFVSRPLVPPGYAAGAATLETAAPLLLTSRIEAVEEISSPLPAASEADGLHRLRIALKKLRYAVEALASSFSDEAEPILAVLRPLQDTLGRIHDLDFVMDRARLERERTVGRPRLADRGLALDTLLDLLSRRREEEYRSFRKISGRLFEGGLRKLVLSPLLEARREK